MPINGKSFFFHTIFPYEIKIISTRNGDGIYIYVNVEIRFNSAIQPCGYDTTDMTSLPFGLNFLTHIYIYLHTKKKNDSPLYGKIVCLFENSPCSLDDPNIRYCRNLRFTNKRITARIMKS